LRQIGAWRVKVQDKTVDLSFLSFLHADAASQTTTRPKPLPERIVRNVKQIEHVALFKMENVEERLSPSEIGHPFYKVSFLAIHRAHFLFVPLLLFVIGRLIAPRPSATKKGSLEVSRTIQIPSK
jgi:hypothetical protein